VHKRGERVAGQARLHEFRVDPVARSVGPGRTTSATRETKTVHWCHVGRPLFTLVALFGPFLTYSVYPGDNVGRYIAPLRKLKAKLANVLRQIRRRIKNCLIHDAVALARVISSLGVPLLDLTRGREGQIGGLPPPRGRQAGPQFDRCSLQLQ